MNKIIITAITIALTSILAPTSQAAEKDDNRPDDSEDTLSTCVSDCAADYLTCLQGINTVADFKGCSDAAKTCGDGCSETTVRLYDHHYSPLIIGTSTASF